jgi:hypothetical protein
MALLYSSTTVTIPLGGNAVTFDVPSGMVLRSIETPADLAINVTFQFKGTTSSDAGVTPLDLMDGGSKYPVAVQPSQLVPVSKPQLFGGLKKLTVVHTISGTLTNTTGSDKVLRLGWSQE